MKELGEHPAVIGVIGGEDPPKKAVILAEKVGELIAKRGGIVVCGGLGGVMEGACRGARAAGGLTVGILPASDKRSANPYVLIPIVTAMSTARNAIVVRTADALIAIDGSYGTLTEIAYALDLGKMVVTLESWPLEKLGTALDFTKASTPEEAVSLAFNRVSRK